eukprot:TRINITY_DN5287_c0_g1_i1.p1 TRINITY_DN5287_c0_g1~~TRINITY_DN5287_c0_g1_i1.p1  ORF type:complete len:116 (-),score=48.31 TRINITY_DN5287_c0_g1_i1:67-372(-)
MSAVRRFKPLFDRVLLKKISPAQKVGGIVLPDSALPKLNEFQVVAVGQGMRTRDGTFAPLKVDVGQKVLVSEGYGGQELKLGAEEFHLYREDDILGVLDEE